MENNNEFKARTEAVLQALSNLFEGTDPNHKVFGDNRGEVQVIITNKQKKVAKSNV